MLVRSLEHCPACGASAAVLRGIVGNLQLMRCLTCDLVYSDPQPVESVRDEYLHECDLATHFGGLEERKRVLFDRRLQALGPPRHGRARLCDVGCGDGLFLELAAERGWEPFGVELNPPAADAAENRGAVVFRGAVEEIESLPFGSFDVVTSWDAIEHTPTPRSFAERLASLTRAGDGKVVLTTLNADSLVARVMRLRWGMIDRGHFTYWNEQSLRALHDAVGLEIGTIDFFGLGRDLVAFMDRLGSARRQRAAATADAAATRYWDSRRPVLLAERTANYLLHRTRLGVGITVESTPSSVRRPSSVSGSSA
jgi:SAM-dependent methyltransferase